MSELIEQTQHDRRGHLAVFTATNKLKQVTPETAFRIEHYVYDEHDRSGSV